MRSRILGTVSESTRPAFCLGCLGPLLLHKRGIYEEKQTNLLHIGFCTCLERKQETCQHPVGPATSATTTFEHVEGGGKGQCNRACRDHGGVTGWVSGTQEVG